MLVYSYSKGSEIGIRANKIMSSRLKYTQQAIEKYGINILGKEIDWNGWGGYGYIEQENFEYNYVDIAYFKILFDKGCILLILYIMGYTMYMKKITDSNEGILVFINIIILIWGMIEPSILELGKNPFIILIAIYLFELGKNVELSNCRNFYKVKKCQKSQ